MKVIYETLLLGCSEQIFHEVEDLSDCRVTNICSLILFLVKVCFFAVVILELSSHVRNASVKPLVFSSRILPLRRLFFMPVLHGVLAGSCILKPVLDDAISHPMMLNDALLSIMEGDWRPFLPLVFDIWRCNHRLLYFSLDILIDVSSVVNERTRLFAFVLL